MYCSQCGKQMDAQARFCPSCGAVMQPVVYVRSQLTRPRSPRAIAGVCSGFALHYGWDLSLVRVLAVVALFISAGTVAILYIAAWIIIPEAPYALPDASSAGSPGPNV